MTRAVIYDGKVPHLLKREQQWFASIIGRPIDEDSRMNPISPSGQSMELEAAEHIVPSPTLRPAQRIQIYNQQYWWRLLDTLHDTFPVLTRLFGYYDFNRSIGIPYVVKYPPNHWSLNCLGDRLAQWIEEEYHANDKALVLNAAQIDWAFNQSFVTNQLPQLSAELLPDAAAMEEILCQPLYAQPHIYLFQMEHHLFHFRQEFLQHDADHWLDHDFPAMEKSQTYFFALYRNVRNEISWKEISAGEYYLLGFFKQGMTIDEACQWLEKQENDLYEAAMSNLQLWFQEWTQRGWLSLQNPLTANP